MPTRWAVQNGNWSSLSTWNDSGSLGFPTASDDIFANTFTVNVDTSFQALTLNNAARARDIATPVMTGYTTPQGTAISSGDSGASTAWRAFNRTITNNNDQRWQSTVNNTGWVGFQFNNGLSAKVINQYLIYGSAASGNNPNTWTFEGSNDGSSWTVLHTVTGTTIGASSTYSSPLLANTTSYEYYRINVTAVGTAGNPVIIAEIEFYERFTAALAAGGSFNFNSGSISGSVTSATPLSPGATNLITVTATTGSVELTLGGAVTAPTVSSTTVISHTGNCTLTLSGSSFSSNTTFGIVSNIFCINKSSPGNLIIYGNIIGGVSNGGSNCTGLLASAGNVTVYGNVQGNSVQVGASCFGIQQSAGNLTVNGNVTAFLGTTQHAINFSGVSLTVNGNVTGGSNTSVGISTTAPTFVTGNVTGSVANGILTSAPVIVTGSVVAQGAAAAINAGANVVFINVSGSVISSATSNAITATAATSVVNLAGNMVNTSGKTAIYCQNLFLSDTATTQAQFFTVGSQDRTLYSTDTFPNLPSASEVRFGTTYGPGSVNTGTLRMASPQDVRSGVLTDNTTGSAILSIESLSNEIETSTDPFAQRLKNIATVDTVGYLLTAFKK